MTYQFTEITFSMIAPFLWFLAGACAFVAAYIVYEENL